MPVRRLEVSMIATNVELNECLTDAEILQAFKEGKDAVPGKNKVRMRYIKLDDTPALNSKSTPSTFKRHVHKRVELLKQGHIISSSKNWTRTTATTTEVYAW